MARVTVEDCLGHVANRFELVLVASKRARQIANGVQPFVEWENDKPTVVALREIAEGYIDTRILEERDQPVDDLLELDKTPPALIPDDLLSPRPPLAGTE